MYSRAAAPYGPYTRARPCCCNRPAPAHRVADEAGRSSTAWSTRCCPSTTPAHAVAHGNEAVKHHCLSNQPRRNRCRQHQRSNCPGSSQRFRHAPASTQPAHQKRNHTSTKAQQARKPASNPNPAQSPAAAKPQYPAPDKAASTGSTAASASTGPRRRKVNSIRKERPRHPPTDHAWPKLRRASGKSECKPAHSSAVERMNSKDRRHCVNAKDLEDSTTISG